MWRLGFSPSRSQLKDIVQDYVTMNKIENPFKNNHPGKDWIKGFMQRNNLSMKTANILSHARKISNFQSFSDLWLF